MTETPLAVPPYEVAVLGPGRVGSSIAEALRARGHTIVAMRGREDDPSPIAEASVVVISVPDDALFEAAGVVARLGKPGVVVIHTCGLQGLEPLRDCGENIAAIHPAFPVASRAHSLDGGLFGITCAPHLLTWCEDFVRELGGVPRAITDEERVRYHAALVMASNFTVSLAGDSAEILGGHEFIVPLLRATVENIATLGPDAALTGPVVRGDAGTVRAHLAALPPHLLEVYAANARRACERALASGRITPEQAQRVRDALEEAMVR